jgi:hypothetical protein
MAQFVSKFSRPLQFLEELLLVKRLGINFMLPDQNAEIFAVDVSQSRSGANIARGAR